MRNAVTVQKTVVDIITMLKIALALIFSIVALGQTSSYNGLGNSSPYTDTGSIIWAADNGCTTSTQFTVNNTIQGTNDPTLYQHGRQSTSAFSCTYTVTNSIFYTITLKFANTQNFTTGQRIFNIFINNALVRANFDLAATAPSNTAFDLGFVIPVSTGQVIVNLQPTVGGVLLNAIGITAIAPGTLTSNNTWTGTNTFTGPTTIGVWNSVISVDGTEFTTCDAAIAAAVTQAGSGKALVIVPSTYSGAACTTVPTNSKVQVWYFNGQVDPNFQDGIFWNNISATPIRSWMRLQNNDASPTGSALSLYAVHRVSGVLPASSAFDATSSEVYLNNSITSFGAGSAVQGAENVVTAASTGSTISDARGTISYWHDIAANSTNYTNVSGFYVPSFVKNGTGTLTNVYGLYINRQSIGTNNFSIYTQGANLFDGTGGAVNEKPITVKGAGLNNQCLELISTSASGHTYDLCETFGVGRLSIRDATQTGLPAWSFQQLSTVGNAEGVISHTNTGTRTYSFPDASGSIPIAPNLLISATAPTISTHFNTSGDSIVTNGTASFTITVGTGTATNTGAISLPIATTGWNCWLTNQTRADQIQQTASATNSATFTNFGTTFAATNWTNSDVLRGGCAAN